MTTDETVRAADEDRWFASRFAPAHVRQRLAALYALNHEIARVADTVTQAPIGDIKLAWWREALAEIAAGKAPRAHPVLAEFATSIQVVRTSWDALERMIEARSADFDAAPFATWGALEIYVDATAGGLARVAVELCDARATDDLLVSVGRAWGYAGLARAQAVWRARGRSALPRDGGGESELLARAEAAYAAAHAAKIESAAFPALGYVALVPTYVSATRRGRADVSPFERQLRLIGASALGRL